MKDQYNDLKVRYPNSLVLVKNWSFYTTFNNDAYILNYLFGYKIVNKEKVGFPTSNITKVIDKLTTEKINYYLDNLIVFNTNNYSNILYVAKNNYYNNLNIDLLTEEIRFLIDMDSHNLVKIKEFLTSLKK